MASQAGELVAKFRAQFPENRNAVRVIRAPGRINLIGDHTDYNGGLVLPMAIDLACWIATAANDRNSLRIHTEDLHRDFEMPLAILSHSEPKNGWSDYVIGVAVELANARVPLRGQDLFISSTIPMGSGLSSSAAIEVGTALALLGDRKLGGVELAKLCQRAENNYRGTPCGIMDQFVVVHGRKGGAIQIDCRSLEFESATLPANVLVAGVNSMVKHELASSEYGVRRGQCEDAARRLGLASLREATPDMLVNLEGDQLKRVRHVLSENGRVRAFLQAAIANDPQEMGRQLVGSHTSLRDDYEVSCLELDFLAATALEIAGVYGARMSGGGFGGCTVNLLDRQAFPEFRQRIASAYRSRYGVEPIVFACEAAAGAGPVSAT